MGGPQVSEVEGTCTNRLDGPSDCRPCAGRTEDQTPSFIEDFATRHRLARDPPLRLSRSMTYRGVRDRATGVLLVTDPPQEVVTKADCEHAVAGSACRRHAAEIDLAFRVDLGSPGNEPLASKNQVRGFEVGIEQLASRFLRCDQRPDST